MGRENPWWAGRDLNPSKRGDVSRNFPYFFVFYVNLFSFFSLRKFLVLQSSLILKNVCVYLCAGPVQKSIDGGFIFVEICLNQGDFTHECREFMTYLCSLIYSIHVNVVNTIHYVGKPVFMTSLCFF